MRAQAFSALGFGIGFTAAWFLAAVMALPLLWYLPLERRFELATTVTTLGMDYFGRLLLAVAAGGLGALIGRLLAPRLSARALTHAAIWLGTLVALTFALQLTELSRRNPTPLEAPQR